LFAAAHQANKPTGQKRIGVVLNRPCATQLNMDILIGIEQAAKSHGYHVSFTYAEENQEQQARDITRLREDHVLGLMIFPVTNTTYDETIWSLYDEHFPIVLIDRYFPDLRADYVGPDNYGGGYRATEHLLMLGHTRIAFVSSYTETLMTTSVRDRWKGYSAALKHYGVPRDESVQVPEAIMDEEELNGYYLAMLRKADRPTAIVAVNDMTALHMFDLAEACGLRVPDDLAVIGFDNLDFAAHVMPALTTILHPSTDVGFKAGNQLISRIEGQSGPPRHSELPTTLIIRSSCGAQLRIKKGVALSSSQP
jgi:DNA-binding LacI/PurR family transcriptional regulator